MYISSPEANDSLVGGAYNPSTSPKPSITSTGHHNNVALSTSLDHASKKESGKEYADRQLLTGRDC